MSAISTPYLLIFFILANFIDDKLHGYHSPLPIVPSEHGESSPPTGAKRVHLLVVPQTLPLKPTPHPFMRTQLAHLMSDSSLLQQFSSLHGLLLVKFVRLGTLINQRNLSTAHALKSEDSTAYLLSYCSSGSANNAREKSALSEHTY